MSFAGKTITLVTGANSGIGLATATALARDHGHHVIIGSRNADKGAEVAQNLVSQGFSAASVQLDLEDESSLLAVVEYISATYGHLDVLVNNAAILIDMYDQAGTLKNLFTRTFNTNVIGTALLTDPLVPLLSKSENPRVVFVSSSMGSAALSKDKNSGWYDLDCKAYDSSKAALNVLALNYARILEPVNGKVNSVCPGLVSTNLHEKVKQWGVPPEVGAQRVVELAVLGKHGPTATWSSREKAEIPW